MLDAIGGGTAGSLETDVGGSSATVGVCTSVVGEEHAASASAKAQVVDDRISRRDVVTATRSG
jgi:hypothetical protein